MNGNTCVHDAAETGKLSVTKFLVEHNGDINLSGYHFKTVLDIAMEQKLKTEEAVLKLYPDPVILDETDICRARDISNPWRDWIKSIEEEMVLRFFLYDLQTSKENCHGWLCN